MKAVTLLPLSINYLNQPTRLMSERNAVFTLIQRSLLLLMLLGGIAASGQSPATPGLISGKITDRSLGQSVPFASVAVKGKSIGTQADADGHYELQLRQPADSLLVSALGYQTAYVAVTTATLDIVLTPAASLLNEVTVHAGENPAFRILRAIDDHQKQNDFSQLSLSLSLTLYQRRHIDYLLLRYQRI